MIDKPLMSLELLIGVGIGLIGYTIYLLFIKYLRGRKDVEL